MGCCQGYLLKQQLTLRLQLFLEWEISVFFTFPDTQTFLPGVSPDISRTSSGST